MLKISYVLPIYNVERYLPMCLDSIRAQTYSNIEIVCVDDGSTDRSPAILKAYADVDNRIKVINKLNGGVSSARNVGIDNASGDIVCTVDPDDLITPNAASRVAEVFGTTSADVVVFGGDTYPSCFGEPWVKDTISPRDVVYDEFDMDILFKEKSHPFAWRTACTRSFLNKHNLRFDEDLSFGEDQQFLYAVYPRSEKTVFISDKLYLYRIGRDGSLMATRQDNYYQRLYEHLRVVEHIARDWSRGGFIGQYGSRLLLEIADFVLLDLMLAPFEWRMLLFNYLEAICKRYFSENQLDALLSDRKFGKMASAVLTDRTKAYGFPRKVVFYLHTLREHPSDFIHRLCQRISSSGPIMRIKYFFIDRLPMSSRRQKAYYDALIWMSSESDELEKSLKLLELETRVK